MDWTGWALFGLIATTALTAVMTIAQLAGLTRLDIPLLLGTMVTEDPDKARVAGFFMHLLVGQGFALGYAAVFALLGEATWWLGGLLGLLHVAVALDGARPPAPRHPSAAGIGACGPARAPPPWSHRACSVSTTARETPAVAIAAHLVYGIALGVLLHPS